MSRRFATTGPLKPWPISLRQAIRGLVAGQTSAMSDPSYVPLRLGPRNWGQSLAPQLLATISAMARANSEAGLLVALTECGRDWQIEAFLQAVPAWKTSFNIPGGFEGVAFEFKV